MAYEFDIEFRTRAARMWVRAMAFVAPVIGTATAQRLALRGARRLTRYRVAGGHWERLA